jgi:uncharacterized protein YllA (UPF0747 family)
MIIVRTAAVYTVNMKNVTFSASEDLIESARERARQEHTTLNEAFRAWLASYARGASTADHAASVVERLRGRVVVGGKLSRDEMNAR